MLTYLSYPDVGGYHLLGIRLPLQLNLNVYGISSIAVGKVTPPKLGHQSLACVNRIRHSKVRLVLGKDYVPLYFHFAYNI